jgi:hypothetical protein
LARSASSGFVQGAFKAIGIVAGDLLFILLAIFGLALLVEVIDNVLVGQLPWWCLPDLAGRRSLETKIKIK